MTNYLTEKRKKVKKTGMVNLNWNISESTLKL